MEQPSTSNQGNTTLIQCTIAANSGTAAAGINVTADSTSNATTLANCIVWNNRDSQGAGETAQIRALAGTLDVNYTCLQGRPDPWAGQAISGPIRFSS